MQSARWRLDAAFKEKKDVVAGENEIAISQNVMLNFVFDLINHRAVAGFQVFNNIVFPGFAHGKVAASKKLVVGQTQTAGSRPAANDQLVADHDVTDRVDRLLPKQEGLTWQWTGFRDHLCQLLQPCSELATRSRQAGNGLKSVLD